MKVKYSTRSSLALLNDIVNLFSLDLSIEVADSRLRLCYYIYLFETGSSAGRPDLLCAQNRFPTVLDPSNIATEGHTVRNEVDINNHGAQPVQPQVNLDLVSVPVVSVYFISLPYI